MSDSKSHRNMRPPSRPLFVKCREQKIRKLDRSETAVLDSSMDGSRASSGMHSWYKPKIEEDEEGEEGDEEKKNDEKEKREEEENGDRTGELMEEEGGGRGDSPPPSGMSSCQSNSLHHPSLTVGKNRSSIPISCRKRSLPRRGSRPNAFGFLGPTRRSDAHQSSRSSTEKHNFNSSNAVAVRTNIPPWRKRDSRPKDISNTRATFRSVQKNPEVKVQSEKVKEVKTPRKLETTSTDDKGRQVMSKFPRVKEEEEEEEEEEEDEFVIKPVNRSVQESSKCSLFTDESILSTPDSKRIVYCAVCALADRVEYCRGEEHLERVPSANYKQACLKTSMNADCLYDRCAAKVDQRMILCSGQLTGLIEADNLSTRNDFHPVTLTQPQPRVARQRKFCLTRLYSPIPVTYQTLEEKIDRHKKSARDDSNCLSVRTSEANGEDKRKLDPIKYSNFSEVIGCSALSPRSLPRKRKETGSKPTKWTPPSTPRVDSSKSSGASGKVDSSSYKGSPAESRNSKQTSDCSTMRRIVKKELEKLSEDKEKVLRASSKHQKEDKGTPNKTQRNKNLNARQIDKKEETTDDLSNDLCELIKKCLKELLSPPVSTRNEKETSTDLRECKPFIFDSSRLSTTDQNLPESKGIPLENQLQQMLTPSLPSKCVEIPPCRTVKDFLELPPSSRLDLNLDFVDMSNLSSNNNMRIPCEPSPWDEYLSVVEGLERARERKKKSEEVMRIVWRQFNGESLLFDGAYKSFFQKGNHGRSTNTR